MRPSYVTEHFTWLLNKLNSSASVSMTCGSLLIANGVSMKQVQEWMGHSDFNTTANIYAHLDYSSKISSANSLIQVLGMGEFAQTGVQIPPHMELVKEE